MGGAADYFLTASGDSHDVVTGFQNGADDYVIKPFDLEVLYSRITALLRRTKQTEAAQYLSVGMTAEGMKKLFCIEASVIAGRPLVITLPITVIAVAFLISASHLNPMEFIVQAPFIPILIFILVIFVFIALAYYIGGKQVLRYSLAEYLLFFCFPIF